MSESLPDWSNPIDFEYYDKPLVSLDDILAVQALAMGYIRRRARTRKTDLDNRRHGFVMYDGTAGEDVYDGTTSTFMGCVVRKQGFGHWNMVVSFLELQMIEAEKAMNSRETFHFKWWRSGERAAWAGMVVNQDVTESTPMHAGLVLQSSSSEDRKACELTLAAAFAAGHDSRNYGIHQSPIDAEACRDLRIRMQAMSERVNPLDPNSIYAAPPARLL